MKLRNANFCSLLVIVAVTALPITHPASAEPQAAPAESSGFVKLAKRVVPSVVNISTLSTVKSPLYRGGQDDLFRKFFEDFLRQHGRGGAPDGGEDGGQMVPPPNGRGGPPRALALGTGFVIDASGLIMTNNHVVAEADEIKIYFTEEPDEKPTDGEVVGRDPELDLALIKVNTKRSLIPIALGDSDAVEVGEYVLAVGNPFGQGHSVTHGIISAKGRRAPDFQLASYIQTDAPINPGNSGGPLVNMKGEVIGINNAIEQRAQGIGFAIPINLVKTVLPQLKTKGSVSRGYIGVLVDELTPEVAANMRFSKDRPAPFVTHVIPGEPAERAGMRIYDVILEFNGKKILSGSDLVREVTSVQAKSAVPVKVWRSGKDIALNLEVGQRPGAESPLKKPVKPSSGTLEKKKPRIDIGAEFIDLTPELAKEIGATDKLQGVLVESIAYGSPADKAGLLRGDVILEVDRKPVRRVDELFGHVIARKSYMLRVRRPDPEGQGKDLFSVVILDLK